MWRRIDRGREYVCWKVDGKQQRQLAHRWEWEQANGPIPDGYEVHHRDHDPLNNALVNLELKSAAEHDEHHQRLREAHATIDGVEHRRCQRCGIFKALPASFSRRAAGTYHGYCKDCQREYHREWRASHREYWNAYHRERRARQ